MDFFAGVGHGFDEAFFMFWETLWALVLGFGLSGAVQAFVSRTEMRKALGDHRPATLGKASFFGVISSSCSYASSALAKSLFARGADFTAAMVFMIASTNLVVELGIVLWLLIGWQFALAEFVGGAIMIVLLGVVVPRVIPQAWISDARDRLDTETAAPEADAPHAHQHAGMDMDGMASADIEAGPLPPLRQRIRSRIGWGDASGYTISDLTMVRKELVIGFVVAGFLAAQVPNGFWQSLFLTGHGFWSSLENVVLGPFLAIISFVCSIGNVPLAAALWQGGISFGGVVSFVFADLITLPLLSIYRKYFGTPITLRILATFWATMSIAGLAVEYLFRAVRISDPVRPRLVVRTGFAWNYTSVLNIIALAAFALIYWLYRHRDTSSGRYAKDPVCGMQVEIEHAPATARVNGQHYWFCSDHCQQRFSADPDRHSRVDAQSGAAQQHTAATTIDPVCAMTVDPSTAEHVTEHDAQRYYFCGPGCRTAFIADPTRYLASAPTTAARGAGHS
ncbi:MAG: permease [Actinomycetota bacterium]|nr:permease [Actinomycetota bacterium]